jgi:hypothetical protein
MDVYNLFKLNIINELLKTKEIEIVKSKNLVISNHENDKKGTT